MDIDDETPFYLELEVDDEISFKQPSKPLILKSDTDENSAPNAVNSLFPKSVVIGDSSLFKVDGISLSPPNRRVTSAETPRVIAPTCDSTPSEVEIPPTIVNFGCLQEISHGEDDVIKVDDSNGPFINDVLSIETTVVDQTINDHQKTDPLDCTAEGCITISDGCDQSSIILPQALIVSESANMPCTDVDASMTTNRQKAPTCEENDLQLDDSMSLVPCSYVDIAPAILEVQTTDSLVTTKQSEISHVVCVGIIHSSGKLADTVIEETQPTIGACVNDVTIDEQTNTPGIDVGMKREIAQPDTEHLSPPKMSQVAPEAVKLSGQVAAVVLEQNVRMSRVPLQLSSKYDEALHMPKYSQAEMDAALEQAQAAAVALTNESSARSSSHLAEMQQRVRDLEAQLTIAKQSAQEYKDATDLQRAQTRALSHRLQMIETELSTVGKSKSEAIVELQAKYTHELQQQDRSHANELALLRKSLLDLEAQKVKAVTESYEAQLLQLRQQHIQQLDAKEAEAESRAKEVITNYKQSYMAKIQVQFDEGNQKYKQLAALKKSLQSQRDGLTTENVSLKESLQERDTQLKALSTSSVAVEACAGEGLSILLRLATALAIASEELEAVSPAASRANFDVGNCRKLGELVQSRVATTRGQLLTAQSSLKGVQDAKESMQAAVVALETSLKQADASLIAARSECAEIKGRAAVAEALLATARLELAETQRDRDDQLNACAKMATASALQEEKLASAQREAAEATDRTANLRKMNEELLAMLEKMYTTSSDNAASAPAGGAASSDK